ncbi:hypothetical protein T4A_12058 [Trichinella pseudospiralis]|uniref:Uncharacterized protein n=1 Tax=Trichinella pseudospiralis TaxID=6337 RepID=A0A0V1EEH9_TRIPS|nr:hypothetical protein T4A_12058 [Trichinella pseudospiralis]KRY93615.1 hypothetical protein T4D_7664 [Trichinella pseudospiralis]
MIKRGRMPQGVDPTLSGHSISPSVLIIDWMIVFHQTSPKYAISDSWSKKRDEPQIRNSQQFS